MQIKINITNILLGILALLLSANLIMICVIASRMRKSNSKANPFQFPLANNESEKNNQSITNPSVSVQSDFFKRSIIHAENVIRGITKADDYAKESKAGSDIVREFMYLTETEKQSLMTALNYYQSDPLVFSDVEKEFRRISAQTMIPLWIVIIRDAMEKSNVSLKKHESNIKVVSIAS